MSNYFKKYIKKQHHSQIPKIKYKTNFTNCILNAFEQRGYEKVQNDEWDIIWSQKEFIPQIYEKKLTEGQRINHFRNYYQLCRKDNLVKNIKKHKKMLERDSKPQQAATYNFCPLTYILPSEYLIFVDEFKRHQQQSAQKNVWIMKPTGKSQGKGIFLFNKLSQVSQWESHSAQPYIVQKYISDPLLIGGKKFDIRLYALVVSYSPLTVYLYRGGFARFTHCRYEESKIQNSEMHLTNVAIQKLANGYDENIGGKWYIEKLKLYLLAKYSEEKVNSSFFKIQQTIIKTLEALQKTMSTDRQNSFQLYGFDILMDKQLDPWLIEVNGSPSMTASTQKDRQFKMGLMEDVLNVIDMEKMMVGNQEQIGGFDLVCKGKQMKSNQKMNQLKIQKISFLATYNNRQENLNKIAKANSPKLNQLFQQKKQTNQKKIMTNSNNNIPSTNSSKRNIISRRMNIGHAVVKTSSNSVNVSHSGKGREFIIKQKVKREMTNQNQVSRA